MDRGEPNIYNSTLNPTDINSYTSTNIKYILTGLPSELLATLTKIVKLFKFNLILERAKISLQLQIFIVQNHHHEIKLFVLTTVLKRPRAWRKAVVSECCINKIAQMRVQITTPPITS